MNLEDKYITEPNSGCWLWCGCRDRHGYGKVGVNRSPKLAHRVSWQVHRGPIPKGICVLHKCDTPACINPDHLYLGTQRDNASDRVQRGRQATGEQHKSSRLSLAVVNEIRASTETNVALARRFGVTNGHVSKIRLRQRWNQ